MANIIVSGANATMRIGNTAKVTGWGKQSIVKGQDLSPANQWREAFASNSIIAQTGGTAVPSKYLILSNSDAVQPFQLTFGTSNALLFLNRTTSNAITLLDRSVRTNSNYAAYSFRTSSNAYAYGDRINSNAIVFITNSLYPNNVLGNNLDARYGVIYQPYHHVFHGVGSARGFVRLNAGFTVLSNASVLMDTLETVSGGFDLRETGTLILNNDLYLSGNVTLTSGGNVKGKSSVSGSGNTIFLGGDLTLSSSNVGRVLHITGDWTNSGTSGDTIIDGQGHCLWIGDRAQIFVDTNVTLTLKNMVIHTGPKSINSVPAIQLAAHGSKLALDNVVMDLGSDFNFINGQLFIHDDVLVTGSSAFVYQSPRPSYITSGATWMFDVGTTFSMAPSAFTTDQSPSMTNNFLVMADPTSVLALNGCTFKTTYTGLRLRTGTVLMDNRVQIDTMAGVDLASTTTDPVSFVGGVATGGVTTIGLTWSPDGRFLAVVNFNSTNLQIYRFMATEAPVLLGTVATGANPFSSVWSPDGRFIAVTNQGSTGASGLLMYGFTGTGSPVLLGAVTTGANPRAVGWSPDGRFLAVVNYGSPYGLVVYRFTGIGAPTSLGTVTTGTSPRCVAWSPDGKFIIVPNYTDSTVQVYRFSGSGVPVSLGIVASATGQGLTWSPDGRFMAVVNWGGATLRMYRFNKDTGVPVLLSSAATGSNPASVAWTPDGRFLAVVNYFDGVGGNTLQIYRFTGTGESISLGTVATGTNPRITVWSPDGRFVAVTCQGAAMLQIFRTNYIKVAESQAMSSSLIFGDSASGSAFDANVQVLSGACVSVNGMVCDDSA